jgi:hypothetical protein
MDNYLERLAALDPQLARDLADPEIARAIGEQNARLAAKQNPRDADRQCEIRAIVAPLLEEVIGKVVMPMIAESEARVRRELRSLTRKSRLRRWSKKDAERFVESYVQSLPKVRADE